MLSNLIFISIADKSEAEPEVQVVEREEAEEVGRSRERRRRVQRRREQRRREEMRRQERRRQERRRRGGGAGGKKVG